MICLRKHSRGVPITFDALSSNTIFEGFNARSAAGSVVKSIEAESPIVSDHQINILLFHVFLASHKNRLTVSKPRRC